ncbi:uncharacterized protein LOC127259262 isoform X2 [Andrographis paniculata]|uniref:uncharacterized protein LOC127259262 isoform X2 n=1 Tax=Andrographis paniculata TaxID=175694 RepID=UPI0021E7D67A|nr:uncharacterized protein LOC127259262 isoform X2 [Andrographis paniculata]
MAPEMDFAAVLDFLRRNGLRHCESALTEELIEKSRSGFHKLFLPMPPPPLIITPANQKPPPRESTGGEWSSDCSSDCEFVTAASSDSTSNIIRSSSQAVSDDSGSPSSSKFSTARDCPVSGMQNDQFFWCKYDSNDENAMPPETGGCDFAGNLGEDKFITSVPAIGDSLMSESYKDYSSPPHPCHDDLKAENVCYVKYVKSEHRDETTPDFSPKKDSDNALAADEIIDCEPNNDEVLHRDEDYEVFDLRIIHRKNRTGFEQHKELQIVLNTIVAGRYYVTEFLGSAAFSSVVQAHDLCSGMDVCLKIIKNDKDFFDQSLDEIKLLKYVNKHDPFDEHHILRLYDYFYYKEHLFIVTELLRANLYEFQKYTQESGGELYFTLPRLQAIARQCLEALLYLHELGIIHCDLKPENILVKSYRRCEIKVIDLGSSCFETDNLSLYVQSRSYRAPEVMLGLPYDRKIDLWSLGCILAELYSGEVLFPNEAIVLLLARMIALLGPIDLDMLQRGEETNKYFTEEYDLYYIDEETNEVEYIIPDESSIERHLHIFDSLFADFLKYLLEINPMRRPTVKEALMHPWLRHTYGEI